jgi:hypothetical protein
MKKGLLQEKFQRTVDIPPRNDDGNRWVTQDSQRRVFVHPNSRITHERVGAGSDADFDTPVTNRLPPGMFISNQDISPDVAVGQVRDGGLAGSTDVSNSVDAAMLKKGFQRQHLEPSDEMYTNEHTEEFYGDATVDGKTGFLERNNYLDRN